MTELEMFGAKDRLRRATRARAQRAPDSVAARSRRSGSPEGMIPCRRCVRRSATLHPHRRWHRAGGRSPEGGIRHKFAGWLGVGCGRKAANLAKWVEGRQAEVHGRIRFKSSVRFLIGPTGHPFPFDRGKRGASANSRPAMPTPGATTPRCRLFSHR